MRLNYFNFKPFEDKVLLTNDFGNYAFVSKVDFKNIIDKNINFNSKLGCELVNKNIIYDDTDLEYSSLLKYDLRRVKSHVNIATSLHIFVVTTACNMSCIYCQANNGKFCSSLYMTKEMAEKAVDIALQSPTHYLSFEFQGGEPLLNFDIIKHIVSYAEQHKGTHEIDYNIVTNLTLLNDEILDYLCENKFDISTSIDGNEIVHNNNRPFKDGRGTFDKALDSIQKIRDKGMHVGAIQTTTRAALPYPKEIVQAYRNLGFDSIFIRPLTPLGKATMNWNEIGYTPDEFVSFYTEVVDELLKINKNGNFMIESHSAILLKRIYGRCVNYMELRSPCGAGIGQLAYYADGNIFTCDEGRMLYEMGDDAFRLGNVFDSSYTDIINNGVCKTVCASSILETIPTCCDCVYQPYCGTCPVVNYAKDNDIIEKEPRGYKCKIYSGMLDYLFKQILNSDEDTVNILKSWSN
ncbi:MAG: His-Xaa-Ser system radical SAM maturase HxsB [Eubacterium sp.]|nr:His-Xaa-Ser system radical SAM maturase HxsB [Eubacterium sp.]